MWCSSVVEQNLDKVRVVGSIPTITTWEISRMDYNVRIRIWKKWFDPIISHNGAIAQLVVHFLCKEKVVGSYPTSSTYRKGWVDQR